MTTSYKIAIWTAVITAAGAIIAALITALLSQSTGNQIQQHGNGTQIACQDHSTCNG
ncbi:MAG TPA: hypothetical protein VFU65_02005 [Actinocrinis sp.]|nr:hypothetical protein [Actinocrinis sp.]